MIARLRAMPDRSKTFVKKPTLSSASGWAWTEALDLIVVTLAACVSALIVVMTGPLSLRVLFGIPFMLFLPGYALVSALFPSRQTLDGLERIALSFALSVASIPPLALAIDRSPWTVAPTPISVALLVMIAGSSTLAAYRRGRLPESDRFVVSPVSLRIPPIPSFPTWDRTTRITVAVLALAVVMIVAGGSAVVINRITGTPLTEFALYNSAGAPEFYPRELATNEPAEVTLEITNHEGRDVTYIVKISGAGEAVDPLPQMTLADGETWTDIVQFMVVETGDDLPVYFELWRADRANATEPYRSLRLMVDGREASGRAYAFSA